WPRPDLTSPLTPSHHLSPTPESMVVAFYRTFRLEGQIHWLLGCGGDRGQFCWLALAERGAGRAERTHDEADNREPEQHEEVRDRARAGAGLVAVRGDRGQLVAMVEPV